MPSGLFVCTGILVGVGDEDLIATLRKILTLRCRFPPHPIRPHVRHLATGDDTMDFKIEDKPAFEIFGKGIRVPPKDNQNMTLIPQFWQTSMSDGLFGQLMAGSKQDGVPGGALLGDCA